MLTGLACLPLSPPRPAAARYYLCLYAGEPTHYTVPKGLDGTEGEEDAPVEERRTILFSRKDPHRTHLGKRSDGSRPSVKSKEWIQNKKERQRRQGKSVAADSKYTGRKRGPKF